MLAAVTVQGVPGPKGSVNAFCTRCAKRGYGQSVVVKEQSETGVSFRKLVARQLGLQLPGWAPAYAGPIETRLTFYIERKFVVRNAVQTDRILPSHSGQRPTHRNSGDVEKHVRTIHDALMDANIILDDSQVWRTVAEKLWAEPGTLPGVTIEILALEE